MEEPLAVRIDPHVHSEESYDGHEPVGLILEQASDIELDGVVITDHDEIDESLRAADLAPDYGLIGVPGVEVSTAKSHLLAIGVEECPRAGRSYLDTVERIRELSGIAIVPHPFQRSRHGVRKGTIDDCDAIEVYNSMLFTGYRNRRAERFAERCDYPKVGASDAHRLPNVGRAYTQIELDPSVVAFTDGTVDGDSLIETVREGSSSIHGKRTPVHRSARQYTKGAMRKALYVTTSNLLAVPTVPASMERSQKRPEQPRRPNVSPGSTDRLMSPAVL